LGAERSPYLLQHADNPVDWCPWGEQAFARARSEDKPLFLSIGYSTCHWCHVMEAETFENESIAAILNEHFVCIKVDREERPDVDALYMRAVQMMSGSGGWPLSVFLTPDGDPFLGGTYYPPEDRYGRIGFKRLVEAIAGLWRENRGKLMESAADVHEMLKNSALTDAVPMPSREVLDAAYARLQGVFDSVNGGFGAAPKFPQPTSLEFLLGYYYLTGEDKALMMVTRTLDRMADGGIFDHLGGGFHRYATDIHWLVPHFEKMLYDQAQLAAVYTKAYQVTGEPRYRAVATATLDYVLRDMTDAEGGFYSAEDADSEGREGRFYVWKPAQVIETLGREAGEMFTTYYGVSDHGLFEGGWSVLNVFETMMRMCRLFDKPQAQIEATLAQGRAKLLAERNLRVRPHRDDKVITGWNGLMISAMARAGAALERPQYTQAACTAADFVLGRLLVDGRLMRYRREAAAVEKAFLEDHAFLAAALLDLYEATFEARWLTAARQVADSMIDLFGSESGGAFYQAGRDGQRLIVREKPNYDGAVPAGNSVATMVLLRLGRMTAHEPYLKQAEGIMQELDGWLSQAPGGICAMLSALAFYLGPSQEIVIAGRRGNDKTEAMVRAVRRRYLPHTVVLFWSDGESHPVFGGSADVVKGREKGGRTPTAYICEGFVCRRPVQDAEAFETALRQLGKGR